MKPCGTPLSTPAMATASAADAVDPNRLAPFQPTSIAAIDEALALAGVTDTDCVWDLGCGDGRMVVRAATQCGAHGVGVEYDAALVERAHAKVAEEGVGETVEIRHGDVCECAWDDATMIFLYLVPTGIKKIYPKLNAARLRPGTRIVTYIFSVKAWEPVEVRVVKGVKLYLYTAESKVRDPEEAKQ